jgi:hypothetical protein
VPDVGFNRADLWFFLIGVVVIVALIVWAVW